MGGERDKRRVMRGSSPWEEAGVAVAAREDDGRRKTRSSSVSAVEVSVGPVLAVVEVVEVVEVYYQVNHVGSCHADECGHHG